MGKLGQLTINYSKLLNDDPIGDYIESIYNVYLQHHLLKK
jgi:hypothetical protein